ncbi:hypothetical protein ONZ45_g18375 [Pleurotus djamor]|nr:hypothetical protein ONZ45_g18375 [Pleurotus djamor]
MSSRNYLLSPIPTESTTPNLTTASNSFISTHHSPPQGNSLLLSSALPNPYEQRQDGLSSTDNTSSLGRSTSSATAQTGHLYPYEESQQNNVLIPGLEGNASPPTASLAALLAAGAVGASAAASARTRATESEAGGSRQSGSTLHMSMAAWQKQLEAEEERAVEQGKAGMAATHPSGDILVAMVDPPPLYSNDESPEPRQRLG